MTDHGPTPATAADVAADVPIDAAAGTVTIPYAMLVELVDPDECRYDRHGACHMHDLGERPCVHEIGQALIARCVGAAIGHADQRIAAAMRVPPVNEGAPKL